MKFLLTLLLLLPLTTTMGQSLNDFQWQARLILLFTPDIDDPLFEQQYALLSESMEELYERQVRLLLITPGGDHENTGLFLQEASADYFYDHFSADPYQFELVLVGLDSEEKFRARNAITPVSVLTELIDNMPMRQQELRQGYGNKSQINRRQSVIPNEGKGSGGGE